MTPILATKEKDSLHFLTRASFTEAPAKTDLETAFGHLSARYILFQTCLFLSGSVDLLYAEPKDSDTNLTSHFQGWTLNFESTRHSGQ